MVNDQQDANQTGSNTQQNQAQLGGPDQMAAGNAAGTQGHLSQEDIEAIKRSVDADAERETGHPTGAIYGDIEDVMATRNFEEGQDQKS